MVATCDAFLQGFAVRLTRLDSCGAPVAGACSTAISEGFIKVEIEADEADGEEIEQTLANGTRCYYRKTKKQLNGYTTNIEFCDVDPELFNIATGVTLMLDDAVAPVAQGFAVDSETYATAHFALEVWTDLADGGCLDPNGRKWGYMLLPWLTNGTVGTPTVENGSANFTISDALTRGGHSWGVGPYDIQTTALGVASPLFSPITSTTHYVLYKVNTAPPTGVCGCQTLVLPT
jgi:hypothetical protein